MMRIVLIAGVLVATSAHASAYEIIDGSGGDIDPGMLSGVLNAVADRLADPMAVQFRNLSLGGEANDTVCGEFNGKNAFGGYVGFAPFYNIRSEQQLIPQIGIWSSACE